MFIIRDAQREGIGKHIRGLAEVNAVLADVRLVLGFVPFESHDKYARMIACFLDGAARRCCSGNSGTGTLIWRILVALRLQMDIKSPDCPGFRNIGNFRFLGYWPLDYNAFPLMPRQMPTGTSAPRLWPWELHNALTKAMVLPRKKHQ